MLVNHVPQHLCEERALAQSYGAGSVEEPCAEMKRSVFDLLLDLRCELRKQLAEGNPK
jgi:hypothetical protein